MNFQVDKTLEKFVVAVTQSVTCRALWRRTVHAQVVQLAGRQRINWGINLVWNPNDLFNAFSYMDFDYEERPGSDAILITWYPSFSSSVGIACKAAKEEKYRTLAAKYRFNLFNCDFQVLAGQAGYDYVLGGGWTGNIGNVSTRGEASWFYLLEKYKD